MFRKMFFITLMNILFYSSKAQNIAPRNFEYQSTYKSPDYDLIIKTGGILQERHDKETIDCKQQIMQRYINQSSYKQVNEGWQTAYVLSMDNYVCDIYYVNVSNNKIIKCRKSNGEEYDITMSDQIKNAKATVQIRQSNDLIYLATIYFF